MANVNILDYPVYSNLRNGSDVVLKRIKTTLSFFTDNFHNHPLLVVIRPRDLWRTFSGHPLKRL